MQGLKYSHSFVHSFTVLNYGVAKFVGSALWRLLYLFIRIMYAENMSWQWT